MVALALLLVVGGSDLRSADGTLPTSRPQAFAEIRGSRLVGGLDGLYLNSGHAWKRIDPSSIKQIELDEGGRAWIRKGNGAVDSLDLKLDRHYHDVLFADARRPWVSCIGADGSTILFGGHGGWMERVADGNVKDFYPRELHGQVVTAILRQGEYRWIGTQNSGLWRFGGSKPERYGLAKGLNDPWVTGLVVIGRDLWIGTATDGIYKISDWKLSKSASPFTRVRQLSSFSGRLVAATEVGAFLREGTDWRRLSPREAYATTPGREIAILSPDEIIFRR